MKHAQADPGTRLMNQVRAGFISQGTSYTAWCRTQGIDPSQARQAIYGTWAGPKGLACKAKALQAAGVREAA